jgi:hypothetical protein
MSGPKSSYYDITKEMKRLLKEQRREEERRRREEEKRRREEERRRREEEKRRREEERRRREEEKRRHEEERKRREEKARQDRIKKSDAAIDKAFENFSSAVEENKNISAPKNNFDAAKFLNQLEMLANNSRLSAALLEKVAQTKINFEKISDSTYKKNFAALNIAPLVKECSEYLKISEEIAALEFDYKILCEMAGETAMPFEISAENILKMKTEINHLREKIAADDEKNYINKCLDEVMAEMGYNVIGSREVTKKSGKHFKSEIFTYNDGTAVNVTASDDGKIVMELCGLDEVDRTPNFSESEQLCQDMENFCKDFGEIEKRLAEKGVVLRQKIQRLPPNVEYAQIINVSDYELKGAVENFRTKRRHEKISRYRSNRNE